MKTVREVMGRLEEGAGYANARDVKGGGAFQKWFRAFNSACSRGDVEKKVEQALGKRVADFDKENELKVMFGFSTEDFPNNIMAYAAIKNLNSMRGTSPDQEDAFMKALVAETGIPEGAWGENNDSDFADWGRGGKSVQASLILGQ